MARDTKTVDIEVSADVPSDARIASSLFEDVTSVPRWHPVLRQVRPTKKAGRGEGAAVEWDAEILGIKVSGTSVNSVWRPGKEFVWRNTERLTGITWDGRFTFNESPGSKTKVVASLKFNVPAALMPLIRIPGVKQLIKGNLQRVLTNAKKATRELK